METDKTKYSKNERAGEIVGLRPHVDGIIFDQPAELGYRCPVCLNKPYDETIGQFDVRLEWSEYNGFLWCSVCNKDYPSALCCVDVDKAIGIYLDCIEDVSKKARQKSSAVV
jgi:hypothetical protein